MPIYKLVSRCKDTTNNKIYYDVVSQDNKKHRLTENQLAYLVGREQVQNLDAQIYQDKVVFRGKNCDLKSIPLIKLEDTNKKETPKKVEKDNQADKEYNTKILTKLYDLMKNYDKKRFGRVPEYEIPNIELKSDYIDIEQKVVTAKDGSKIDNHFIIDIDNNKIYFRQFDYKDKFIYSCDASIDKLSNLYKIVMHFIGFVCRTMLKLDDASDYEDDDINAFNAFTGASNYYNDIMRSSDTKYVDKESIGTSLIQIVRMLRCYDRLSKDKINDTCLLFRGGQLGKVGDIERGFLSHSYSANVAINFMGSSKSLLITPISSHNLAIITEAIAVCLENGELSEREITIRPYLTYKNIVRVGTYNNENPVYIVEYDIKLSYKEQILDLLSKLKVLYNYMDVYLLAQILERDPYVEITGDEYGTFEIRTKHNYIELEQCSGYYYVCINGEEIECTTKEKCDKVIQMLFS